MQSSERSSPLRRKGLAAGLGAVEKGMAAFAETASSRLSSTSSTGSTGGGGLLRIACFSARVGVRAGALEAVGPSCAANTLTPTTHATAPALIQSRRRIA